MNLSAEILRHRGEIAKAIRNHKYDFTPSGIAIPGMKVHIGGVFESWLNGREHQVHPNLVPLEGRQHALNVLIKNVALVATWYCALFSGNVTPDDGWTGASFDGDATEFTSYDETTRVEFVDGALASSSVSNSASKADFTIATGVEDVPLYGAALLQASAKEATSGVLLAASNFSSTRIVNATDVLSVQYTLSMTSE